MKTLGTEWKNIPEDINDYQGFVYLITNLLNNKKYIGKKFFWSKRTLKPLKGKTRKRHKIVESDWRDYWGSSPNLNKDIEKYGKENFKREILECYISKSACAYFEAKEQFDRGVLLTDEYYNGIINIRLGKLKLS